MTLVHATSAQRLGPYDLGEVLGRGGMAEVYVARRSGPHGFAKKLAVKRLLPHLASDPRFVAMFCDEARICAGLSHPNIVQVLDFGEADGSVFMAMEYVDGISLAKLLRAAAARQKRFPLSATLFIVTEVLKGLAFAHEAVDDAGRPLGIVHRDVSPGNILIGRSGEVKLTDFGILRCVSVDRRTQPGEVKGKLGYMSPEQVVGNDVDPRSDLFTLGIIFGEMLLLRPLFAGDNELEILSRTYDADLSVLERYGSEVPPSILSVAKKALARERRDRFQSAREFYSALMLAARTSNGDVWDHELIPWLGSLGVLTSRSGTHEVARAVAASAASMPVARPSEPTVVPPPPEPSSVETPAESQPVVAAGSPSADAEAARRYRVRVPNGRVLEALTLPQICELLGTGRLRPEHELSIGGSLWAPVSSIPLFANTVSRLGRVFASVDSVQSAWRWNITRRDLPRVLFRLAARRHNGLLVARSGRREKRVWLNGGMPSFVASSDRTELLGAYLVQRGVLKRSDVDRALEAACSRGGRLLGEALVERGMVSTPVLLQVLGDQLCERFAELVRWSDGQLTFVVGQSAEVPHLPHPKSAATLIARAVRRAFEPEEIASWYLPMSGSRVALRRGSTLDLDPTDAERRVLALAAEGPSLEGLLREASAQELPAGDIWRALYLAISAELVAFDQAG